MFAAMGIRNAGWVRVVVRATHEIVLFRRPVGEIARQWGWVANWRDGLKSAMIRQWEADFAGALAVIRGLL
jgi:hypothetical protein